MADNGGSRTTFLTVAEVAQLLRVSRMTVYRWVHAGEIPAVQFGRSYRVPRAAVDQFMEQAGFQGGFAAEDDERRSGTVG
ncbi:helix-turn-helix domain-containing protein [Demequina sp. B12]|uniref:helix-turn-helix domain-containing protein n=1 Tax=Demequina sp. B12 TaxID=2992757 RepID=UPI00237B3BAD|nr:helix-turn-helix domain-containing protein [Demequina sp. B12]MDE0572320.1 helix-turn-helix domain-containing protein [Demequina sp. B12]